MARITVKPAAKAGKAASTTNSENRVNSRARCSRSAAWATSSPKATNVAKAVTPSSVSRVVICARSSFRLPAAPLPRAKAKSCVPTAPQNSATGSAAAAKNAAADADAWIHRAIATMVAESPTTAATVNGHPLGTRMRAARLVSQAKMAKETRAIVHIIGGPADLATPVAAFAPTPPERTAMATKFNGTKSIPISSSPRLVAASFQRWWA